MSRLLAPGAITLAVAGATCALVLVATSGPTTRDPEPVELPAYCTVTVAANGPAEDDFTLPAGCRFERTRWTVTTAWPCLDCTRSTP